jgi:hypothetical protein
MSKLLSFGLLTAFALAGCDVFYGGEAVPFSRVERIDHLRVQVSGTTVIRDQSSWEAFWQQHGEKTPAPSVDFQRETVFGVFYGGAFHSGCRSAVEVIRDVNRSGGTVEIRIGPLPDLGPCDAVVYPLDVVVADVPPSQVLDVRFRGHLP